MTEKESWYILLEDDEQWGIGECGLFRGLSADDHPHYVDQLHSSCLEVNQGLEHLLAINQEFPSIQFGFEQAFASLNSEDSYELIPSDFTRKEAPIPINGLIWMGDEDYMRQQIEEKLKAGYNCLKLKIGALDFQKELNLLKSIRDRFKLDELEIRVDANGAFSPADALFKLEQLARLDLHSIEQPIRAGQELQMKELCKKTPLPIALDEELIGHFTLDGKRQVLDEIAPHYIILKPSLIGGWSGSDQWIEAAESRKIGWWITSALESNIGLNAIAQYTFKRGVHLPQGLGTGGLFTNNWDSPLEVKNGALFSRKHLSWNTDLKRYLCM